MSRSLRPLPPLGPIHLTAAALTLALAALAGCTSFGAPPTPTVSKPRPTIPPSPSAGVTTTPDPGATAPASPSPTTGPKPTLPARPTPPAGEEGESWQSPVDGMILLYLPADDFPMGTLDEFEGGQPDEEPFHRVELDAYWIDQTEVTRGMFAQCVEAGGCTAAAAEGSEAGPEHPVTGMNWDQARRYCTWAGRRLPTEAEWERAARGEDGRRYPWGWIGAPGTRGDVLLNYCDANCPFEYADPTQDDGYARTAPVGSYPAGASPIGALDMAGNVWEWTADWYAAEYYSESPSANPPGPARGRWRVIRGGSWVESAWEGIVLSSRASNRGFLDPNRGQPDLGFRCALSAAPAASSP